MTRIKINYLDKVKSIVHLILLFLVVKNKIKFLLSFHNSNSQLHQDLFVLDELNYKLNGFFVEFGACDGKYYSNTLFLEKKYNWNGLLSEPCVKWHAKLEMNRSAKIDYRCVWRKTGDLIDFFEDTNDPALSLIKSSSVSDFTENNLPVKDNHSRYEVMSVSLNDLLENNNVPFNIDFLSIDTEGSEFEILNSFNFSKHRIKVICIEHNYGERREKIFDLLTKRGYERKYKFLSRFDDWYVLK